MNIIRGSDLVERPWRNGGGITREIAETRRGADLLWRLSMADVASDGPFSDFSGLMRVLTVIEGGAMELITPQGTIIAAPREPVRFDGGLAVTSKLTEGAAPRPQSDVRPPEHVAGDVCCSTGRTAGASPPQRSKAMHCISSRVRLALVGGKPSKREIPLCWKRARPSLRFCFKTTAPRC